MAKKEKNIKKRKRRTEAQLIEDMEKQLEERKRRFAEKAKHSSGPLEEAKVLIKNDPEWWSEIEVGKSGVSFKTAVSTAALIRRVASAMRPWTECQGAPAFLAAAEELSATIEDLIGEEISKGTKSDSEDEEYEDEEDDDEFEEE